MTIIRHSVAMTTDRSWPHWGGRRRCPVPGPDWGGDSYGWLGVLGTRPLSLHPGGRPHHPLCPSLSTKTVQQCILYMMWNKDVGLLLNFVISWRKYYSGPLKTGSFRKTEYKLIKAQLISNKFWYTLNLVSVIAINKTL